MSQIQLGDLTLIRRIAAGGMAEVWEAKKRGVKGFEKRVAVKVILPHLSENQEFIQMFLDEGRLAAHLEHPNICQIIDLAEYNGLYYMAMEYIDGVPLNKLLKVTSKRKEPIPFEHCCYIVAEACSALDYAHSRTDSQGRPLNLVHRDISPQNIMLSYSGEVKILDFGIAKAATQLHHTRSGVIKGKYSYMSPEQATGQKLDNRSDIFALGIVLWELLAGKMLFKAENEIATLHRITGGNYPLPTKYRPECPPQLVDITMKALAHNREERYQTCREFQIALEEFLDSFGYSYGRRKLAEYVGSYFPPEERKKLERRSISTGNYSAFRSIFDTSSAGSQWRAENKKITPPSSQPKPPPPNPPPSPHYQPKYRPTNELPSAVYSQPQAKPLPSEISSQADVFSLPITGERTSPKIKKKKYNKPIAPIALLASVITILAAAGVWFFISKEKPRVFWTVVTSPEGAILSVEGEILGKTPHTLEVKLGSYLSLKLYKSGYREKIVQIKNVTEEMVKKPLYIRLEKLIKKPSPQPKEKNIKKPQKISKKIKEKDIKKYRKSVKKTKVKKVTYITVKTDPMGGRVYLNGNYLGIAPISVKELKPGQYKLKVERLGFHTKIIPLKLHPGEYKEIKVSLQPAIKRQKFTSISIFSSPAAKIYIEGKFIGMTPILNRNLKPGKYRIKWVIQPYNSIVYSTEKISAKNIKIKKNFKYGKLWLLSRPQADIYLNGILLGKSNKPPYSIPQGEYRVMFSFPNGNSIIKIVTVKPGKKIKLAVKAQ